MQLTSGRWVVAAVVVSSIAAAVLLARAATVPGSPSPSSTASPSATPFSPHVPARTLAGPGRVVETPQSARALPGIAYAVRLLAPCVLVVDFDGSFWKAPRGFTLLKPTQPVTVTLRSGRAVARTGGGQAVTLVRVSGPVTLPACPPRA